MSILPKYLEPRRTSAPAKTPLTLAEAKQHLRVESVYENAMVQRLINLATDRLDGWNGDLGRALITQTWRIELDRFPARRRLDILIGLVQSVTVTYSDSDNVAQTFASANYAAHDSATGPYLFLDEDQDAWPDTFEREDAVRIDVVAGYGDDETDVPEPIRHAMCLMIGHWWKNREHVSSDAKTAVLPLGTEALLLNYRKPAFI